MLCYDMCSSLPAARVLGTWKLWPVSASVSGKKKEERPLLCQSLGAGRARLERSYMVPGHIQ